MKISAIVLAAGRSKRMGTNKLLLDIDGQTLVERIVSALLESTVDEVIVVAGFERGKIQEKLRGKSVRVVINRHYPEGMASSIREGLKHVCPDSSAVLIALADQPLITSRIIDRLLDAHRKGQKGITCPVYKGRRGHPVIFSLEKYGSSLSQLAGDTGGRGVLEAREEDLQEIAVKTASVTRDIDLWEDYEDLKKLSAQNRE